MKQVVIVDDEPALLLTIQAGFEKNHRFQLLTAGNGMEALDILENNIVDLVVTDLRMPEMDGIELLSAMSQSFPEIPSIVMTAFGNSSLEQQLKKAGTVNMLEKPLDIDTLEQSINNALDFYQYHEGGPELEILLQLVAMERKTTHVKVVNQNNQYGSFFFHNGYLIDAEQDDLTGDKAVLSMLEWKKIKVIMNEFCPSTSNLLRVVSLHLIYHLSSYRSSVICPIIRHSILVLVLVLWIRPIKNLSSYKRKHEQVQGSVLEIRKTGMLLFIDATDGRDRIIYETTGTHC
jgi:CheY-like chemotaxis protein